MLQKGPTIMPISNASRVVTLLAASALIAGCQSTPDSGDGSSASQQTQPEKPTEPSALPTPAGIYNAWRLVEVMGDNVTAYEWMRGREPSMTLSDNGRIGGSGGVNTYGGQVTIAGASFKAGPIQSTKMAGADWANRVEYNLFQAIDSADRIAIRDKDLLLLRGEKVLARFIRATP